VTDAGKNLFQDLPLNPSVLLCHLENINRHLNNQRLNNQRLNNLENLHLIDPQDLNLHHQRLPPLHNLLQPVNPRQSKHLRPDPL